MDNSKGAGSDLMGLSKRRFLKGLSATGLAAVGLGVTNGGASAADLPPYDVIIVGAGSAGLPTAIFAAQRNARVLLIEAAGAVGGTLFMSIGQMSAAGSKLQKSKGIEDSPQAHYDDVMRLSGGTADPKMLRLAVENAAQTVDWLCDNGFKPMADQPVFGGGHEPYPTKRLLWSEDKGLGILSVLADLMQKEVDRGKITLLLNTQVRDLIQQTPGGAVTGVIAAGDDGKLVKYPGHQVVLTSGGYGSNSEMFEKIEGIKRYAQTVYAYSMGAGAALTVKAGGSLRGTECRQPLFSSVLVDQNTPSTVLLHLAVDPRSRQPWEIMVNSRGERFYQEDAPSYNVRERSLKRQPEERCWVVFDNAILNAAPPMAYSWTTDQLKEGFGKYPTFFKADSLEELAKKAGLDGTSLQATVADYNRAQGDGKDKFNRQHMPLPIKKGPFYALQVQGCYLVDSGGVRVDTSLRILGKDGRVIPNLYAAGEILGYGQLQGAGYSGGMAMTPALTFGRLLGQSILKVTSA